MTRLGGICPYTTRKRILEPDGSLAPGQLLLLPAPHTHVCTHLLPSHPITHPTPHKHTPGILAGHALCFSSAQNQAPLSVGLSPIPRVWLPTCQQGVSIQLGCPRRCCYPVPRPVPGSGRRQRLGRRPHPLPPGSAETKPSTRTQGLRGCTPALTHAHTHGESHWCAHSETHTHTYTGTHAHTTAIGFSHK